MHKVLTQDIKAGMIMAEPIEDSLGRLLIAAGEPINEKYVTHLLNLGIDFVLVKEVSSEKREEVTTENPEEDVQNEKMIAFEKRFEPFNDEEPYQTIKEMARKYLHIEQEYQVAQQEEETQEG